MHHLSGRCRLFILVLLCIICRSLPAQTFFLRDTFCSNQILLVNGHLYGPDKPSGTEILPGAGTGGVDSIIEVWLVFLQPAFTLLDQTRCLDDTVWVNGVPYHAGFNIGQETIEGGAANGCDSVIQVNLTFKDKIIVQIEGPLCEGDTILVNGKVYDAFHTQGEELFASGASSGCDSIVRINLTPVPLPYSIYTDTLCADSAVTINGRRYDRDNRTGLEILPNAGANGCDSLVNVQLFFRELWVYLGEDPEISSGDSICLSLLSNFKPISVLWAPALPCGTPDCLNYCDIFYTPESFQVFATDTNGCVVSDEIRVRVNKAPAVYAPNVFMPDGHWPNNYFSLSTGHGVLSIRRMVIANRWGEIIMDRSDIPPNIPEEGWDGTWKGELAPPGVYGFWAEVEHWDHTTRIVSGSVTLLR